MVVNCQRETLAAASPSNYWAALPTRVWCVNVPGSNWNVLVREELVQATWQNESLRRHSSHSSGRNEYGIGSNGVEPQMFVMCSSPRWYLYNGVQS